MQELWQPIPGQDGFYASNLGRIRNKHGRVLSQWLNNQGYLRTKLRGKEHLVHRLVASAFLGPLPEGLVTRHGPGGQQDNRIENLCYGTPLENTRDRYRDGPIKAHNRILTEEQVAFIRQHDFAWGDVSRLAKLYGVAQTTISAAKTGQNFSTP